MLKSKIFVAHSFGDGLAEKLPGCKYVHVDLRGVENNEFLNECSIIDKIDDRALDGADFFGIAHYRRYLDFDDSELKEGEVLADFEPAPKSMSPYAVYCMHHSAEYFAAFQERFSEKIGGYPAIARIWRRWWTLPHSRLCMRNMFVAEKTVFRRWLDFMKDVLAAALAAKDDTAASPMWKDQYQRRQPAFVCERMTAAFLDSLALDRIKVRPAKLTMFAVKSPYQRTAKTRLFQYGKPAFDGVKDFQPK